jgi:uncharacterized SAM-binding protein YcdF (DUF218 family)
VVPSAINPITALRLASKLWIVSDNINPADVIIVLGGGLALRPLAAAALYQQGIAPRVAVAKAIADGGQHASLNTDELLLRGVPRHAIDEFDYHLLSTYGEALGVRTWAKQKPIKKILIPIEIFSTRRVRWIFHQLLEPKKIHVSVYAIVPQQYNEEDWWRHKAGRVAFRNEVLKMTYYRLRYSLC